VLFEVIHKQNHSAFNQVHAGAKVRDSLPGRRYALTVLRKLCNPCELNFSCRRQIFSPRIVAIVCLW